MEHCRNGLTILNFGELASPPYPSGGGSGGGGSGSAGSGTTGSAGGGSDTESDQESAGALSSVKYIPWSVFFGLVLDHVKFSAQYPLFEVSLDENKELKIKRN